jgi:hypothetical protein
MLMQGVKYPGYHILSLGRQNSPTFETELCLLPSPVDGYILYVVMVITSLVCIVAIHSKCWERQKEVQYIELDNLGKDEENLWSPGKRIWRWDIRGIVKDITGMGVFILVCIILQILGIY